MPESRTRQEDEEEEEEDSAVESKTEVTSKDNKPLKNFDIRKETIKKLEATGITTLFPIQAHTFEHVMAGKDIIGRARTGSGKTLSFVLPMYEQMLAVKAENSAAFNKRGRAPSALILSPTRELAKQICKVVEQLASGEFSVLCVYGGTPYADQEQPLMKGVDIVVGTPGRVGDLMERNKLRLKAVRFFVLDEADEMLNIGFKEAVDKIFDNVTTERADDMGPPQTMLFSATVPDWVQGMTKKYLKKAVRVDLVTGTAGNETATKIKHLCLPCAWSSRARTIGDMVLCYAGAHGKTIIFTETKKEANELALDDAIKVECAVLHGDIAQQQRETTFQAFRDGKFRCLVATDVAARGLDIPEVDLVIMCHPTKDPDTYVHRSGRTGRAGRSGTAVTFFTPREMGLLKQIERRIKAQMTRITAPQPADIIKANARDIKLSVEAVHPEVLPLFKETAAEMIEEMGPEKALASALAVIAGQTNPLPCKSMLTSLEGFKTFYLKTKTPMAESRLVFVFLRKVLPQSHVGSIKSIKLFEGASPMGAAFDVPEDKVQDFLDADCPPGCEVMEAVSSSEDLPALADAPQYGRGGQGPGGHDRRNSWGGSSNYGSPQQRQNGSNFRSPGGGGRGGAGGKDTADRKVFVGGLPNQVDEGAVGDLFKDCGSVENVYLLTDQATNTFKGVGFVTLSTADAAAKACQKNGSKFQGRALRVNMANSKRQ